MTLVRDLLAVTSAPLMIGTLVLLAVGLVNWIAFLTPFAYAGIIVAIAWGLNFLHFKKYIARKSTVKGAVLISGASSGA